LWVCGRHLLCLPCFDPWTIPPLSMISSSTCPYAPIPLIIL
jgi:hypothetical protein